MAPGLHPMAFCSTTSPQDGEEQKGLFGERYGCSVSTKNAPCAVSIVAVVACIVLQWSYGLPMDACGISEWNRYLVEYTPIVYLDIPRPS